MPKKVGDKAKGICPSCGPVEITYAMRRVPFSGGRGEAEVLAGVCERCLRVVCVPVEMNAAIAAEQEEGPQGSLF